MGYPTTDFNPSARSNGQTIDAAHVNDLQNEVAAVVSALRGTIMHAVTISGVVNISGASTLATLQAGASTLATLQAGASTVASLSVTGASTFASRPVMPSPDIVKVYRQSTVTLGSSNASTLVWDAQEFITNSSMHALGANPERLVPQTTGVYRCVASMNYTFNSTGYRGIRILDSSAGGVAQTRVHASTSEEMVIQAVGYKRFDEVGGYLVVTTLSSGASTLSLSAGSAGTWATLEKL